MQLAAGSLQQAAPIGRSGGGLYGPRAVTIHHDAHGSLAAVDGGAVENVREQWLVEDRWWSGDPLRRHYLELVLEGGRCLVVFRDLVDGSWYAQR